MDKLLVDIKNISNKYNFNKVVLFGSRARGDNTPKSDVDLAIFASDRSCQAKFTDEIEELDTLLKFDIVFITGDKEDELLKNIQRDGVVIMDRFATKLENFSCACERLKEAIEEYNEHGTKTVRDGVIQRFEFTVELAWKSLREYLIDQGFARMDSPKAVFKEAFTNDIINDSDVWINMLNDRNMTSHLYKDEIAQEIFKNIVDKYVIELSNLVTMLCKNK